MCIFFENKFIWKASQNLILFLPRQKNFNLLCTWYNFLKLFNLWSLTFFCVCTLIPLEIHLSLFNHSCFNIWYRRHFKIGFGWRSVNYCLAYFCCHGHPYKMESGKWNARCPKLCSNTAQQIMEQIFHFKSILYFTLL